MALIMPATRHYSQTKSSIRQHTVTIRPYKVSIRQHTTWSGISSVRTGPSQRLFVGRSLQIFRLVANHPLNRHRLKRGCDDLGFRSLAPLITLHNSTETRPTTPISPHTPHPPPTTIRPCFSKPIKINSKSLRRSCQMTLSALQQP